MNFPYQHVNKGKKVAFTSPKHLNIGNTPQVRNLKFCDFFNKGHLITNIDRIRGLIGQPNCHYFTIKGLIHHVECKADAHFSRTESLKINKTPPLHSMATVCKLFEHATKGSKPYRLEMSKRVVIDYGWDKWRKMLDDNTISLDEVRNTYKLFHTKDLET